MPIQIKKNDWLVDKLGKESKMMSEIYKADIINVRLIDPGEDEMPIKSKDITNAQTYLEERIKADFPESLLTMMTVSSGKIKEYPNILVGVTSRDRYYWFGLTVKAFKPIKAVTSAILHKSRSRGMPMFIIYKISPTEYEIYPSLSDTLWDFIKGAKR